MAMLQITSNCTYFSVRKLNGGKGRDAVRAHDEGWVCSES